MNRLRIVPIVEGHGEVEAVPVLLRRIWNDLLGGEFVEVFHPVRQPRSKLLPRASHNSKNLLDTNEITRAVRFAVKKLQAGSGPSTVNLILLLLDANSDCPKQLVPKLVSAVQASAGSCDTAVVLAKVEYETWFVAAAESLREHLKIDHPLPELPEEQRCGKGWIEARFFNGRYSETIEPSE